MGDDNAVACTLNTEELTDRRARWDRLVEQAFVEREPTARGQRLVFRREAGVETELRELARLEKECCAFADWEVGEEDDRVVLDVGGTADEAVAAVRAMFSRLTGSRALH
ncbi:MAG TPA: hypothetical protein VLJ76_00530 [Gaiellaceae bacterium]|nr:hypothetical protein [Gaiellaceae bacterium]